MKENMDEVKQLLEELITIIQQYGGRSYSTPKRVLEGILAELEEENIDIERIQDSYYGCMYTPKTQMEEFYIWKDNIDERRRLNSHFENIRNRIEKLLMSVKLPSDQSDK